ncbi:GNAT family N-acetyltransferase [Alsobacter sp. KACC 23698]|uniref:GNAT family N-acetyltransferase n=1 Tax=Alsobacter sp. KACC 23698 TaxID=3149229 RepID=A0AAU7JME9_9HYPH
MRDSTALETPRLSLAPLEGADAGGLFVAFSDEEAMRFWDSPAHRYPDETRDVVEALRRSAHGAWTLRLRARPEPAGLVYLLDAPTGEPGLGYILRRDLWGRGLATEACRAALGVGFDVLGLGSIETWVDARNAASIGVARRLGFVETRRFADRFPHEKAAHETIVSRVEAERFRAAAPSLRRAALC